jgi:uncharacterized membrane protein YjfL (UPF0719 family)
MEILIQYGIYLGYSAIAILLLRAMKLALNFKAKNYYSADDELNQGNLAVGFRRAGAYFGLTIAVVGVMYGGTEQSLVKDMVNTLIYGILGVSFMILALVSADKVLISGIDNKQAIKDGNVSVGIMEFGVLVATGIIASAAIKLDDGVFYCSIIYFLVGQISLFLIISAYSLRMKKLLNLRTAIAASNKSVGVYIAGKFIAYSLLLHASIYNLDTNSTLLIQMTSLISGLLLALVLMSIIEVLVDKLILTKVTVKQLLIEDLYTQSMQLAFIKIGMALILSFTLL